MRPESFLSLIVIGAFCFLVSACATPQHARAKGAVATFVSQKSAREVTNCVAAAWESAYGHTTSVNVRPIANGYSLRVDAAGNTQVLLDVTDTKTGSVSSYFKGNVIGSGRLDNSIQPCQ